MVGRVELGRRPRVTVGFVHVGESTVDVARERILAQEAVDVHLTEIAHLPQLEAHASLYSRLDSESETSDLLVKVDGDMVIMSQRLFAAAHAVLDAFPDVDALSIGVDDWFSRERIDGLVVWRGGVRWLGEPQDWRPDRVPTTAGRLVRINEFVGPVVLHAPDPTADQAFRYGLHRGLKAARTGSEKRLNEAHAFVRSTEREPHPMRLLAVAGMIEGLRRPLDSVRLMSTESARDIVVTLDGVADPMRLLETADRELRRHRRRGGVRKRLRRFVTSRAAPRSARAPRLDSTAEARRSDGSQMSHVSDPYVRVFARALERYVAREADG